MPAFVQRTYGIRGDQMDLMGLLDQEAPLIAQMEEESVEVAPLPEEGEAFESAFDELDSPDSDIEDELEE